MAVSSCISSPRISDEDAEDPALRLSFLLEIVDRSIKSEDEGNRQQKQR